MRLAAYAAWDLTHEFTVANALKTITVRVNMGVNRAGSPRVLEDRAAYEIDRPYEIPVLLQLRV